MGMASAQALNPFQSISCRPHRSHRVLDPLDLNGEAQPPNVNIHGSLLNVRIGSPDRIEQLPAREHSARVLHKEFQQPEFGRPKRNRTALAGYPVAGDVQRQVTDWARQPLIYASRFRPSLGRERVRSITCPRRSNHRLGRRHVPKRHPLHPRSPMISALHQVWLVCGVLPASRISPTVNRPRTMKPPNR